MFVFLIYFFGLISGCAAFAQTEEIASVSLSDPSLYASSDCAEWKLPERFPLMEPVTNKIGWDINMSPYAGGEDLLFANRSLEKLETYFLSKQPLAYSRGTYARFWRLSELVAIWLPVNYFVMLVQHEVFGHGYRIRDLNKHEQAKVIGYEFSWPPPYGHGGAATSFATAYDFTTTGESTVASAGVEGTSILALLTKLKWLESKKIDPRESVLYLLCEQDLTLYIGTLKDKSIRDLQGHDINDYVKALNYTYPDHLLSRGRLRSLSWINLADPFTFYAVYSWFQYLSSGEETKIPMILSRYLPGFRLGLTPFGPQVFFENFILLKEKPIYAYFSGGHHADNTYLGTGVYVPKAWTVSNWSFGMRIDLWRQPKLLLNPGNRPIEDVNFNKKPLTFNSLYSSAERHSMRSGACGSLIVGYKRMNNSGYEIELGYKSRGFLPGYSLYAAPTVRFNCLVTF